MEAERGKVEGESVEVEGGGEVEGEVEWRGEVKWRERCSGEVESAVL